MRDSFSDADPDVIADALEEIASPLDEYAWNSDAIYSFWDNRSAEILYIGLAGDIAQRFRQHSGIISTDGTGNKFREIRAHLAEARSIGFSVILHFSAVPMKVARNAGQLSAEFLDTDNEAELRMLEGRLIAAHQLAFGDIPVWNKIGGSAAGAKQIADAQGVDFSVFELVTGRSNDGRVSRASLRELAEDPTACAMEFYLDAVRATSFPLDDLDERFDRIASGADMFAQFAPPPEGLAAWLTRSY